ncbi:MAG: glycine--tRNA ligase subunit beta [Candidatus Eisenbacteria bacterium]
MSRDLLFEIGVEELPSSYVLPALEQLERGVRAGLQELRLAFDDVTFYGTPRRLTVLVTDVAERQSDFEEEAMGPAAKAAFDAEGKPTKALVGFCAGKGVDVSAVRRVETPKGEYVAVTVKHVGKAAAEVLPGLLGALAPKLQFPKTMRWDAGDYRFGRPVRWLVALFGDAVLPVQAFGLTAGRHTFGHRFLHPGTIEIPSPRKYVETLKSAFVLADHRVREIAVREQIDAVAAKQGGRVVADDELVDINNFLVEWPTGVPGEFAAQYLDLPREVIVTALREHQRFHAIEKADGTLLPGFLAVRNGDDAGLPLVRKGNEGVLVARLEDAKFYWDTDCKQPPADIVEKLSAVVWMEGLGSLREKATRLESLGGWLADKLAPAAKASVTRAALLCKTDLLGEMIGSGKEYASLEGIMGGYYAKRAGEPADVCTAIAEHYRPRGAGDDLPASEAGALLALADKLDHVAGAFVAGKSPSGSEDPYGVRRAGNGAVRIVLEKSLALDLRAAAMEMTRHFFAANPDLPQAEIMKKLGDFLRTRVDTALEDRGVVYDTREAALEARIVMGNATRPGWCDAADALARAQALGAFRGDPRFAPLVILFKRVANILKASTDALPGKVDESKLAEKVEKDLLAALKQATADTAPLWDAKAYDRILPALLGLESAIHAFFDGVMVNAEDAAVRQNRLQLLADVRDLFVRGWDFSKVVVEGEKA